MNKIDARKIAEKLSNEQLQEMLNTAKEKITDWTKVSNVNKAMTKGLSWNVLGRNFDINTKYHILAKTNMVREFGEYLPPILKPIKKIKVERPNPVHQDPEFLD